MEARQKTEFYRIKMQEIVLCKSRCDTRLNEITERVSSDKREVEILSKKYEDKYKQSGDVASKLTLEEATFRDIQAKKVELYKAIVKLDQDGKIFTQSTVCVASTLMENGGVPQFAAPETLLKDAIHVISCGYEDKTDWGSEIGWIYGSVTYDILTGFQMHARGWRSIYYMPPRLAFKGSTPINLPDRLNQVLRWALGSVEILFSRHCRIWYSYSGQLKWLERFAYINTSIYPITAIPLVVYCTLPVVCLLTGKFIIPLISNLASLWFISLFLSIFATGILEMRWIDVGIDEWWRNEQFWVIGGENEHYYFLAKRIIK